jgi:phosphoenolpyruvate carboxykinase (GTP)
VDAKKVLQEKLSTDNFEKLMALANDKMHAFVAGAIELANPDSVFVVTDAAEDIDKIRQLAIGNGETKLATQGHTYHFDGPKDQARDKANTKYLLPKGVSLGESLSSMDKEEGTAEVRSFLKDAYAGKQMFVCFYCLGPTNSEFSISCVQITDSPYVVHSENILYRSGYEQFKRLGNSTDFFRFLHTQGETDENGCSVNVDKRRIYMDLEEHMVYSTNTQYAGNTVGLKKLALRLAIDKSSKEGWLAEHMFVMGVHGPNDRVTYFTGAFPSACGKTSTSMIPGQTIVGDDIAYFRKTDGVIRTVNVEQGIFGIIADVNPDDDPVIYKALQDEGEVIFGNVLIKDDKPYWIGSNQDMPESGTNYAGQWKKGDANTPSHKNARYTLRISALDNKDPMADDPLGVPVGAIVYGGRDSDTLVPIEQAFDWTEGIVAKGASIESETTAATLGAEGVRTFNIMSNMDFVSLPLGRYIQNNLDFADGIDTPPSIFSTNYFLKGADGKYLNGILDKMVWILWAELRTNGDVEAIKTPTGFIPKYEDLKKLFKDNMDQDYTKEAYIEQFSVRIPNILAKYERVEAIYKAKVDDTPQVVYDVFNTIKERLAAAKAKHGDNISPFDLE